MTPKEIDQSIMDNAWQAPVVSAMMHNVQQSKDEKGGQGSNGLADVYISLVPGQKEDEGRLFNSAFVYAYEVSMLLYVCCIRYGSKISLGASFSKTVMEAPEADMLLLPLVPQLSDPLGCCMCWVAGGTGARGDTHGD